MIGSFTLIRNEAQWIAGHLSAWLPVLSQMVFFDGNSTDGTLEIIEAVKRDHPQGQKIKLVKDRDPKDLQDDYVRIFNECLWAVDCDLALFLHPDMLPAKVPANFDHLPGAIAASVKMRSFAGEPGGKLYEIKGRGEAWKNIYRLRNPDLGAHYWGHYGHSDEDVYFRAITGNKHEHYGTEFHAYPYMVMDSGLEVLHYSDVRTPARRLDRMVKCLMNNGYDYERARLKALSHPRVTLKDGDGFRFEAAECPPEFVAARNKYQHLERTLTLA